MRVRSQWADLNSENDYQYDRLCKSVALSEVFLFGKLTGQESDARPRSAFPIQPEVAFPAFIDIVTHVTSSAMPAAPKDKLVACLALHARSGLVSHR